MKFFGGRFNLLPANQNIFYTVGSEKKFEYALEALSKEVEFKSHGASLVLEPIFDTNGALLGGKLGKASVKNLPIRPDGKMVKRPEVLYPHILFFLFPEEQIILVQRDHSVFSTDLNVFRHLERYLGSQLLLKGLEVVINPLTVKGQFWEILNESEKIYSIRFKLAMPNFLGSTEKDLRDTLNSIKNTTNSTNLDIAVNNSKGELEVSPNGFIQPAVNWSENGAGEWTIRRKLNGKKRASTIRNSDQLAVFEYSEDFDTTDIETIKAIRSHLDISVYRTKK